MLKMFSPFAFHRAQEGWQALATVSWSLLVTTTLLGHRAAQDPQDTNCCSDNELHAIVVR